MHFFILIFMAISPVYAQILDRVHSAGISMNTVTSESELQNSKEKNVMTFKPNVPNGLGLSLETEHFGLTYIFAGQDGQYKDTAKTKFQDFRFNYHIGHFDFRLMYQDYRGALVDENGKSEFYSDYKVRAQDFRVNYYTNHELLDFIRDGKKLSYKVAHHEGMRLIKSWFVGLNFDSRNIGLPQDLDPKHQEVVDRMIPQYNGSFYAFSAGPLFGWDGILFWENFFTRFKIALGSAIQNNGGSVGQSEAALSLGVAFKKHHMITMGVDMYTIAFKDSDQRIRNTNSAFAFGYTYTFDRPVKK